MCSPVKSDIQVNVVFAYLVPPGEGDGLPTALPFTSNPVLLLSQAGHHMLYEEMAVGDAVLINKVAV